MIFLFQNLIPTIYNLYLSLIIYQNVFSALKLLIINNIFEYVAKNIFTGFYTFTMLKPSYLYKPHKMTRFMTIKHKGFKSDIYSMIDTKNGNVVGEMIARPVTIRDYFYHYSPNAHTYTSFFIDRLQVFVKNVGIGSIFINIAKKESIRRFCSGNVHLISKNI